MSTPISFDEDQASHSLLKCPLCGDIHVHIDDIGMAGRPLEDGDYRNVMVNSDGVVSTDVPQASMADPGPYQRRHHVSLHGWCETCGGAFAIVLAQHKGNTVVLVQKPGWTEVSP